MRPLRLLCIFQYSKFFNLFFLMSLGSRSCQAWVIIVNKLGFMAAIDGLQKGDDTFYAKVVDGKLYVLKGDVFGSPHYASGR